MIPSGLVKERPDVITPYMRDLIQDGLLEIINADLELWYNNSFGSAYPDACFH